MVEMIVQGLKRCHHSGEPVLLLKEKEGQRYLPLRLAPEEARILTTQIGAVPTCQSPVSAMLAAVLDHLDGKLTAVILHLSPDRTLESCLRLHSHKGSGQIESHPIAALALAFGQGIPIYLNVEGLESMGFTVQGSAEQEDVGDDRVSTKSEAAGHPDVDLPPLIRDFLSTLDLSMLPEETGRR
ncbi:MAG: hypothetical protein EPO21_23515 [Chloroflexota bacterium]|nr:MAG: hypothetical protein EPO21_23515 [Chloroflexota bacterium]